MTPLLLAGGGCAVVADDAFVVAACAGVGCAGVVVGAWRCLPVHAVACRCVKRVWSEQTECVGSSVLGRSKASHTVMRERAGGARVFECEILQPVAAPAGAAG